MSSGAPTLPSGVASEEELIHLVDRWKVGQYMTVVAFTFLVHEYIVTVGQEKEHVWLSKPWMTIAKFLFYIIRYLTPIVVLLRMLFTIAPSPTLCATISFTSYGSVIVIACVEIVLMLRVWALYGKAKWATALLLGTFIAGVGASIVILTVGVGDERKYTFFAKIAPTSLTGCSKQTSVPQLFFLYLIVAVVECLTFVMTVAKAWTRSRGGETPIVKALLKHGSAYFAVVFFSMLLNILSFTSSFLAQAFVTSNLGLVFAPCACARLILSLKSVYSRPVNSHSLSTDTSASLVPWNAGNASYAMDPLRSTRIPAPTGLYQTQMTMDYSAGRGFDNMADVEKSGPRSPRTLQWGQP